MDACIGHDVRQAIFVGESFCHLDAAIAQLVDQCVHPAFRGHRGLFEAAAGDQGSQADT